MLPGAGRLREARDVACQYFLGHQGRPARREVFRIRALDLVVESLRGRQHYPCFFHPTRAWPGRGNEAGVITVSRFDHPATPPHLKVTPSYCSVSLLTLHLLEGNPSAGDLGEDLLSGGGPHEWFRVVVVGFQVVLDGGDEFVDAVKHAAADGLVRDFPKPT